MRIGHDLGIVFVDPAHNGPSEGGSPRDPRPQTPGVADERTTLLAFLAWQRATLAMKCRGLGADDLARRSVEPSTMSLLGLLRHVSEVERHWIRNTMAGGDAPAHYFSADDPDGEFDGASADPEVVAEAWRVWEGEVAYSDRFLADVPDLEIVGESPFEGTVSLRWVLVHMIEEYARHIGHADLLRERIDGAVGE